MRESESCLDYTFGESVQRRSGRGRGFQGRADRPIEAPGILVSGNVNRLRGLAVEVRQGGPRRELPQALGFA